MKAKILVIVLLATYVSSVELAEGQQDVSGEKTMQTERSSEYKAEGKEFETVVPIKLEYNTEACEADLSLEYFQKEANAHVKSVLSNEECGASSGSYTVRVQYTDSEGQSQQVEFEETWTRNDDADVISEKNYPVGDDTDIVRIKSRKLSCRCDEPRAQEQEPVQ